MDARADFLRKFRDFAQSPSVDRAKSLRDALTADALHAIDSAGQTEYFLAPLLTLITEVEARNKNEIVTNLIAATTILLSKSRIKSARIFETVLAIMLRHIAEPPDFLGLQKNLSEERKLCVTECIDTAFRRATSDVVEQFYTKQNTNKIAQCLIIMTTLARAESFRALRLAAVKCMMSLFWVNDEADPGDIVLRVTVADATFLLIPKVLKTLVDIASGDMKQGEALIQMCVRAICRILHLIFHEYDQDDHVNITEQTRVLIETSLKNDVSLSAQDALDVLKLPSHHSVQQNAEEARNKPRSTEWLAAASVKLLPLFDQLGQLAGCDSVDVRTELSMLVNTLLTHCQKHMAGCVPKLLEISMALHDINVDERKCIYNDQLINLSEEMFEAILIRLPRVIHTGYADEQIANFRAICGLTKQLCQTDRMTITLTNDSILDNLVCVLMSAVESYRSDRLLDVNNIIYDIDEAAPFNDTDTLPWKDYQNLRDPSVTAIVRAICRALSGCPSANVLVLEKLVQLLQSNSVDSNEALVIIQFFVEAEMNANDQANESMHSLIMAEILQDFRWRLATETDEHVPVDRNRTSRGWYESKVDGLYESAVSVSYTDSNPMDTLDHFDRVTIKDVKSNIQHMCLIVELVSLYAKRMGRHFDRYLLKSLHRLLENSASMYYTIRMSAVIALHNVKCAYRLDSISALINNNIDYITHAIEMALKKPDQIDVALRILSVVLHYSSPDAIAYLEHIVTTLTDEMSKIGQSPNIHAFIQASVYVLTTIRSHSDVRPAAQPIVSNAIDARNCLDNWLHILHSKDDIAHDEFVNVDDEANEEQENEPAETDESHADEPEEDEVPPLVVLAKNMMTQIIGFFASKEQLVKLAALKCLSIGLDIIKDYENELLPIVHQMWAPFVGQCVEDKSPVVLRYCIRLYLKLATYAKDFINSRSSSDILPHISSYLQMLSRKPAADKHIFLYEHSQESKLLYEFMRSLPNILVHINVQERDFDNMLNAVIWLLDANQPLALQLACIDLLKQLSDYDVCAVFVKLLEYRANPRYSVNCEKLFPSIQNVR